ncbi:hypothetical protein AmDm5_1851 [Acetobacter malorum]|nr:hypothetical protein AmDm5_1851 [Acetobacter malorum]
MFAAARLIAWNAEFMHCDLKASSIVGFSFSVACAHLSRSPASISAICAGLRTGPR